MKTIRRYAGKDKVKVTKMKYLALGVWIDSRGGSFQSFTLSRPTDSEDLETVLEILCKEAQMEMENTESVFLMENGGPRPVIKHFWGTDDFMDLVDGPREGDCDIDEA